MVVVVDGLVVMVDRVDAAVVRLSVAAGVQAPTIIPTETRRIGTA